VDRPGHRHLRPVQCNLYSAILSTLRAEMKAYRPSCHPDLLSCDATGAPTRCGGIAEFNGANSSRCADWANCSAGACALRQWGSPEDEAGTNQEMLWGAGTADSRLAQVPEENELERSMSGTNLAETAGDRARGTPVRRLQLRAALLQSSHCRSL
jgi:hypothetical protein